MGDWAYDWKAFGSTDAANWLENVFEPGRSGYVYQLFDGEGHLLAKSANLASALPLSDRAKAQNTPRAFPIVETVVDPDNRSYRMATYSCLLKTEAGEASAFAQAGILIERYQGESKRLLTLLGLGAFSAIGLALGLGALMFGRWFRDLDRMQAAAQEIAQSGDFRKRLPDSKSSDLQPISQGVNDLLQRIETTVETQRAFVADASHEIRTPLTILRGEIEVALRQERVGQDYQKVLKSNLEEVSRLSHLAENLLTLAHLDAGQPPETFRKLDLVACAQGAADRLRPMADSKAMRLSFVAHSPIAVVGDPTSLDRVIFNLIENAIRYSPEGESVSASVQREGMMALLQVSDTGYGIPADQLDKIFLRFHRVESSRARRTGGSGLGLAIVKAIVEAHRGSITVSSTVGKGTTFEVRLPLAMERLATDSEIPKK